MAKVKIPKKVAGVKVPKKVRKRANKALKIADSPVAREVAVAALGAVGGTRAARKATGGRALKDLDIDTVIDAAREAAVDGLRRFLEGFEEGLRKAADAAGDAADAGQPSNRRDASGRGH